MVWSNWQGAIWRGAALVLLFWSGLAWTQSPQRPAADPTERIMVVHENGKSTRCRVLESWQLPDGRVAHLLEGLETSERITIVDDHPPAGDRVLNPRAMPKRIFNWGMGRQTPPAGSPIPPQLRHESGVVIKNETPAPSDAVQQPAASTRLVKQGVDDQAIGGFPALRDDGPRMIMDNGPEIRQTPGLLQRLFSKKEIALLKPADPQVVEFRQPSAPGPMAVNDQVTIPLPPLSVHGPAEQTPFPTITNPPSVNPPAGANSAGQNPLPYMPPANSIGALPPPSLTDAGNADPCQQAKKPWRPGANIYAWIMGKPNTVPAKSEDAKKQQKLEEFLAQQNKVADKELAERVAKTSKQPFSTAMMVQPNATKPEPSPLAIPVKKDPLVLPPPAVAKNDATQKRDLWSSDPSTPILPPGRSLLDPPPVTPELVKLPPPPQAKVNDPLLSPERFIPSDVKPKGVAAPSVAGDAGMLSRSAPTGPQGWPLGTQSVLAAKNGLAGPVTYVPVPTVTVPQPHNPPVPPVPQLPDPPQLNAFVNAFSPPPAPKGQQQPAQQAAFMQPQGMMPQGYPTMQQQQMLAYQQQMMAQQMMMQGYRPNPYMMNPYMPQQGMMNPMMAQRMPSAGPMTNFSRNYAGPMAPNPVPSGFAPAAYPPMAPMMPQQPGLQPVAHQQMPTQQQAIGQQVDQLIKVMRESPYPAQREWAAQTLTSYDWRSLPQIVPALLQSASQDPAASVRAGCVYSLGRMGAAAEPVLGTLQGLRTDADPRVRQEVEQTFTRLGQTPMLPR